MDAPGKQRIVGKVDTGNDVGDTEGNLFGFGEEVIRVAIEHHTPYFLHRHELFGDQLGGVEDIEAELLRLLLGEHLQPEFPLGIGPCFDPLPKIAPVIVGVGTGDLHRFVPDQGVRTKLRLPEKLH